MLGADSTVRIKHKCIHETTLLLLSVYNSQSPCRTLTPTLDVLDRLLPTLHQSLLLQLYLLLLYHWLPLSPAPLIYLFMITFSWLSNKSLDAVSLKVTESYLAFSLSSNLLEEKSLFPALTFLALLNINWVLLCYYTETWISILWVVS